MSGAATVDVAAGSQDNIKNVKRTISSQQTKKTGACSEDHDQLRWAVAEQLFFILSFSLSADIETLLAGTARMVELPEVEVAFCIYPCQQISGGARG